MKKFITADKFINSRFVLKTGSMLFLLFFAFFSLAAPLVAQIGSALFILGGMLLAPFVQPDTAAPDELPPLPEQACYASAWNDDELPDEALQPVFRRLQLKQQTPGKAIVSGQANWLRIIQLPAGSQQKFALFNLAIPEKLYHTTACPVRAGPDKILFAV